MPDIDWNSLSFSYTRTRTIVYSRCIDGKWETPVVTEDFSVVLNPFAGVFHYAPSFNGLNKETGNNGCLFLESPLSQCRSVYRSILFVLQSGSRRVRLLFADR